MTEKNHRSRLFWVASLRASDKKTALRNQEGELPSDRSLYRTPKFEADLFEEPCRFPLF